MDHQPTADHAQEPTLAERIEAIRDQSSSGNESDTAEASSAECNTGWGN